jgi:hypothetical protein
MYEISNTPLQYLYVVHSMYVMLLLQLAELVCISLMRVGRPVQSWGLRSWDAFQCGGLHSGAWSSSLPCYWGLGAKRIGIGIGPCDIAASGISCPWLLWGGAVCCCLRFQGLCCCGFAWELGAVFGPFQLVFGVVGWLCVC